MNDLCKLLINTIKNPHPKEKSNNFLETILRIIDVDLNTFKKEDIIKNVNIFRRKLGNDLIQKNLYKNLPNKLRFKKNSIHLKLINNEICDEYIYQYLSYYLELNILIIHDNTYRFVNTYDEEINTIILLQTDPIKFIPIYVVFNYKLNNIFEDEIINEIVKNFELNKKLIFNDKTSITDEEIKIVNKYKNCKLNELQDICKVYDIDIFNNNKLKKKIELFEEFKNKLINDIKLI